MLTIERELNPAQEVLLRALCLRPRGEAPRTEVDGRVARGLERRKLVAHVRGHVVVTGGGRAYHDAYLKDLTPVAGAGLRERDPRKDMLAALSVLAKHLRPDAEIDLSHPGDGTAILAYADDVIRALRRHVERAL